MPYADYFLMGSLGAQKCREMLARNHLLAEKICAPEFRIEPFEQLQQWQLNRLADSYRDLSSQDSMRPACEFFLSELYGGLDFLERDQDMHKVMPLMEKFLPGKALMSLASAFELQAISLEFDMDMARILNSRGVVDLDVPTYGTVYRACGRQAEREKQILLIRQIGIDLADLVGKTLLTALVRLLRGPAHAAGFGTLQEFLESGLVSFRKMDDPVFFIDTVYQREWASMQKLFAGDENPFRL